MVQPGKSISPLSREASGSAQKKQKTTFGLSRFLNFFKLNQSISDASQHNQVSTKPTDEFVSKSPDITSEIDIVDSIPLQNDFSSSKKKRLSIQGHLSNNSDHVPRSSVVTNNLGFYKSYYDNLQTERQESSNDLERRMSTIYDDAIMKDGVGNVVSVSNENAKFNPLLEKVKNTEPSLSRDGSPLLSEVKQNSLIPFQFNAAHEDQSRSRSPAEHEFAPLYKDTEGNLVRPPFINLDPRERYHLLQLKRTVEASDAARRRLKYMINPNETKSQPIANNKVETSTQTHDVTYVSNKLNFSNTKKQLAASEKYRITKKPKNTRGGFCNEIFYDLDEVKSKIEKRKNKLDGYLGNINKPDFKMNDESSERKTQMEIGNDDDEISSTINSRHVKTTNDRFGLEDSLLNNKKPSFKLDENYVAQTSKLSNIIKLKEDEKTDHSKDNASNADQSKDRVQPSSGFNFQLNKNDMESIVSKHNKDEESITNHEKASTSNGKPTFSFKPSSKDNTLPTPASLNSSSKPLFSFGDDSNKKNQDASTLAPTFAFGKQEPEKKNAAPSFAFGKTENKEEPKPAFSFGKTETDKDNKSAPTFSFGNTAKKSDGPTSLFSAKNTEDKPDESASKRKRSLTNDDSENAATASKPLFSFGKSEKSKNESTPTPFSFGEKSEAPKPLFSFGSKDSSTSAPLFGSGEKKSETPQPLFGGKTDTKEDESKPSFGGTSDKDSLPKPVFGSNANKNVESAKPLFSANSELKDQASKPLFGGELKEPKPLFGESKEAAKPLFGGLGNFGGPTKTSLEEKKEEPQKPLFGGNIEKKDEVSRPLFGNISEKKDEPSKPSFSFSQPSKATTDGFSFGAKNDKPSFSFGGSQNNTKDTPAFGGAKPLFNITDDKQNDEPPAKRPMFSFGNTSKPSLFGGNTPQPNPSSSGPKPPAFSFGAKDSTPGVGSKPSTPPIFGLNNNTGSGNAFNNQAVGSNPAVPTKPSFEFNFGATTLPSINPAPPSNPPASAPAFSIGGPSRSNTPQAPAFGGMSTNNIVAPQPSFGGFGQQQLQANLFKPNQSAPPPAFLFGGASRGGTPVSMMGQGQPQPNMFGNPSNGGTPTPPIFGSMQQPAQQQGMMNGMGGAPQQPYTPPLVANRKILPVRTRRR